MSDESFVLVSLKESKAKKLAQVINNDTSRLILDFLTKNKSATESEIAEKLNVPISTVHYNLLNLVENNLITADEYHYSKKGKTVNHYKLSNKLIIIAPKEANEGLKARLKALFPLSILAIGITGVIHFASKYYARLASNSLFMNAADTFQETASGVVMDESFRGAAKMAVVAPQYSPLPEPSFFSAPISFWFFLGTLSMILGYIVYSWYIERKR